MYLQKTFKIPLYDCKVQFIVSKSATKTVNRLYKKYNTGMTYNTSIAGFMLTVSMNVYYVIIDEAFLNMNSLVHEVFHCATAIAEDRAIQNEESKAWIAGLIAQEISDFLNLKKVKIG